MEKQKQPRRRRKIVLNLGPLGIVVKIPVRVLYFAALILLVGVLAVASIFGGYKLLCDFRAQQMAKGAMEFLAQGKTREALFRARSALTLTPEGPEAWRSMAAVMESIGNPLALGCYEKVIASGAATSEDRAQYLQAALRFGQTAVARGQAEELAKSGDTGYARLVSAEEMMKQGDAASAEKELRGVPGSSAFARSSKLMLAQMLAAQKQPEAKEEALSILRELSAGTDATAASALAAGLTAKLVPDNERAAWLDNLEKHPAADDRAFLTAKSLRLQADPASRNVFVAAVMERFGPMPLERRNAAAVWLNQIGEHDNSLRLISSMDASGNPDSCVAFIESLAGKGKWAAIESFLSGNEVALPISGALLDMFRARAARMLGKKDLAAQLYRQAVDAALAGDPRQTAAVISFLDAEGQKQVLRDSFTAALERPSASAAAKQGLFALGRQSRDAAEMRRVAAAVLKALPADKDAAEAAMYYDLVLGKTGMTEAAWRMREEDAKSFQRSSLYALALLKQNLPEKAVRVFDGMSVRSDRITPEQKAVVVSVLAANGRMDQAQAMASTLDVSMLTEQEAAMVNDYLQRGKQSASPQG